MTAATSIQQSAIDAGRQPLLSVRGVKTYYGNIIALKGVDLDVHEGEIVTLIGANGAGKSTLMMTIFGNPRARGLPQIVIKSVDLPAPLAPISVTISPRATSRSTPCSAWIAP